MLARLRAMTSSSTASTVSAPTSPKTPVSPVDALESYKDMDTSNPVVESALLKMLYASQLTDEYVSKVAPYLRKLVKQGDMSPASISARIAKAGNRCVIDAVRDSLVVVKQQLETFGKVSSTMKADDAEDMHIMVKGGIEQAYKSIAELIYDYETAWKENFVRDPATGKLKMKPSHIKRVAPECSAQYAGKRRKTLRRRKLRTNMHRLQLLKKKTHRVGHMKFRNRNVR